VVKGEYTLKIRETICSRAFDAVNNIFMFLVMAVTVYPVLYVVLASMSDTGRLLRHEGLMFWPLGFSLSAFTEVFRNKMITNGYLNTFIILAIGVPLNILMTAFGAYFLSRRDIMLKKAVMLFIAFTMFFSGGMVPFYLTVKGIGLYDSLLSLILPVAVSTFNLIIMRTSFMAVPPSMDESAMIDGAGDFTVLFRIIMPLSMPVIAVMVLYYTVGHWNSWFNAMLFIQNRGLYPLQLALREILIQNDVNSMAASQSDTPGIAESLKYAVIVTATLPILAIYPFLQKYFVKGVMIGAVKE
jgi:putative aldouronate transport system permease protein